MIIVFQYQSARQCKDTNKDQKLVAVAQQQQALLDHFIIGKGFGAWSQTVQTVQKQTKENTMGAAQIAVDVRNNEQNAREHLERRLRSTKEDKFSQLKKFFNLEDDDRPVTPKEIRARFESGRFTWRKLGDEEMDLGYYRLDDLIRWRDPAAIEDKEGYRAASTKMTDAYQAAKDELIVFNPEKGLETLRRFENADFTS
jgi:hypothetical protein